MGLRSRLTDFIVQENATMTFFETTGSLLAFDKELPEMEGWVAMTIIESRRRLQMYEKLLEICGDDEPAV